MWIFAFLIFIQSYSSNYAFNEKYLIDKSRHQIEVDLKNLVERNDTLRLIEHKNSIYLEIIFNDPWKSENPVTITKVTESSSSVELHFIRTNLPKSADSIIYLSMFEKIMDNIKEQKN